MRAADRRYTVKAAFATVQGEGAHAGTPCVFVRLVGCNLWSGLDADRERDAERHGAHCPLWCDTDFRPDEATRRMTAAEIAADALRLLPGCRLVVVTGGEPLLQLDAHLVRTLRDAGCLVAVETNGTKPLRDSLVELLDAGALFVTCSPKTPPSTLRLQRCSEVKVVVPDYAEHAEAAWRALGLPRHRFVQPRDPSVLVGDEHYPGMSVFESDAFEKAAACAFDFVLAHPDWRVSMQTHKLGRYP